MFDSPVSVHMYRTDWHKQFGEEFRKTQQLTLSILKEFGFGLGLMEQRIMAEAEELVALIRNQDGKPWNPAHLFFHVHSEREVASIIFGQRVSQTDEETERSLTLIKPVHHPRRWLLLRVSILFAI